MAMSTGAGMIHTRGVPAGDFEIEAVQHINGGANQASSHRYVERRVSTAAHDCWKNNVERAFRQGFQRSKMLARAREMAFCVLDLETSLPFTVVIPAAQSLFGGELSLKPSTHYVVLLCLCSRKIECLEGIS
jgi:hypothetical protein